MIWLFGEDTELGEGANFGSGRGTGDGLEKAAGSESSRGVGSGRKRGKWRNNAWYFLFEKGLKRRKPSRKFKVREEGGLDPLSVPLILSPMQDRAFSWRRDCYDMGRHIFFCILSQKCVYKDKINKPQFHHECLLYYGFSHRCYQRDLRKEELCQ